MYLRGMYITCSALYKQAVGCNGVFTVRALYFTPTLTLSHSALAQLPSVRISPISHAARALPLQLFALLAFCRGLLTAVHGLPKYQLRASNNSSPPLLGRL